MSFTNKVNYENVNVSINLFPTNIKSILINDKNNQEFNEMEKKKCLALVKVKGDFRIYYTI